MNFFLLCEILMNIACAVASRALPVGTCLNKPTAALHQLTHPPEDAGEEVHGAEEDEEELEDPQARGAYV
jgi:hypothetical protein